MSGSQHHNDVAAGQFYDALWSSELSAAALVHGSAYVGQECLLASDEILAFARRAGITADTLVLDIGSGRGGPACYLAQQLGCRVVGIDASTVGHLQAVARAGEAKVDHLVQFRETSFPALLASRSCTTQRRPRTSSAQRTRARGPSELKSTQSTSASSGTSRGRLPPPSGAGRKPS